MPTYEYICTKCDHEFEKFQPIVDKPLTVCPKDLCKQKRWGKGKVKNSASGIPHWSPSDATHAPAGGLKIRLADAVARFLVPDHFLQPRFDVLIGSVFSQQRAQIRLGHAE